MKRRFENSLKSSLKMKSVSRIVVVLITGFILLGGLTGCVGVRPWEREILADETMRFDADSLEAGWHLHIQEVTEGARGGHSGTGGGCGCR